jgi:hypothetical protein
MNFESEHNSQNSSRNMLIDSNSSLSNNKNGGSKTCDKNNNPWLFNTRSKKLTTSLQNKNQITKLNANQMLANQTIIEAMNETEFDQTFYEENRQRNIIDCKSGTGLIR